MELVMQSILIVDDRSENLTALETLLERPDVELLKSDNGNDALKLLLRHDVALVLLDVQMPGMNGFEMAELMRRNKKTQNIPIIFVTANGDKRQLFRGYEVGAVDYLAKPIEREVLLSKVRIFLELDSHKRELEQQLLQIQELKQQNEQLLQALGDGVVAVDPAGSITFVNPAMKHQFGIEPQQITGQALESVLFQHGDGRKMPWKSSEVFLASSKGERLQKETGFFVRCGEKLVPAHVSAAPIPSPEGYGGAVVTLRAVDTAGKPDLMEELARKNRKQARKRIGAVLRLFDRSNGKNLGRLANISLDGFKLAGRDDVPVGSRYPISMVLPETLAGSNTLSFDAQAVWCRPAEDTPGEYRAGFRIIRISENDLRILVQLIEKY
ncbi:MAG: sensory box protein/response regulator [Moraxellaceae bacterium]|jgi:PAS domain S-box-containing protein|nr:sensory box protein/response regulator [Moraxellaceae bacterium]